MKKTRAPKEYLEQGLNHCGAYSTKAVLSAFGKDTKKTPQEYYPSSWGKLTSLINSLKVWPKVLREYGVPARTGNVRDLSDKEKIKLLKTRLDKNKVMMLRIGNGYTKSGKYYPFIASFLGHWITLWGYNEKKRIFYVYDSWVPLKRHTKKVPVGNTTRNYKGILRDWSKGFPFRWRYSYIEAG